MHPDLVAISNVWQADVRSDTLRAEHEKLVSATAAAIAANKQAVAARDAAIAALAALKDRERANNRELDTYTQKRDTTRKMIDGGTAPDYAAAERQLANCIAKVDEHETIALELLELIDAAVATKAAAETACGKAADAEKEARAALGARDAGLRTELAAALAEREARWKELHHEYQPAYMEQRRRKRPALVVVNEAVCTTCQMRVAPQKIVETQLGKGIHTCAGCGGWILPG